MVELCIKKMYEFLRRISSHSRKLSLILTLNQQTKPAVLLRSQVQHWWRKRCWFLHQSKSIQSTFQISMVLLKMFTWVKKSTKRSCSKVYHQKIVNQYLTFWRRSVGLTTLAATLSWALLVDALGLKLLGGKPPHHGKVSWVVFYFSWLRPV